MHEVDPVFDWNEPREQLEHALIPMPENAPEGQVEHAVKPVADAYEPAEQEVQAVAKSRE